MLAAKLFAALAVFFALLAALARLVPFPSLDVPAHATYFVFGPILVLLFCVVASANFALLYYAGVRFFHARWNRTLTILHLSLFVFFGISLSVVFTVSYRIANGPEAGETLRWLVIPSFLGILSLVASLAVFGVNLALVVVQIVRARFATH
jgi:hypothetical protein